MNYPRRDLKASLIDKHFRFKELTEKITHQLENLSRSIDGLEEYKERLEKTKHEKVVRKKMRDVAIQTNKMIVHISDHFKELKDIRFGDPKDRDNRIKTLKRLRGYFTRQHDRFVQSLSAFQDKEKIFIEQRMSMLLGPDTNSILSSPNQNPNYFQSITDPGIEVARQDMDFYHSLLVEREHHVQQFRGIAYEIKLKAVDQAKAIQENQRDLENAVSDMSGAEHMVNDGHETLEHHHREHKKKKFDAGCKRNVAVCLLVVIVCGIVLISTLATGVLKLD